MVGNKLKFGGTIGIIAPSDPITEKEKERIKEGITQLEELGFEVKVGEHIYSTTLGYSASIQEKVDDIHNMFREKTIKAIFTASGGYSCNSILPYIDYEIIKENPKIIMGYSDITNLTNAIFQKTGLITFQGLTIYSGFKEVYNKTEMLERLVEGKIGLINKKTKWKCIQPGKVEGILVGGNLTVLTTLVNTEYMPELENAILMLEDLEENDNTAESVYRSLCHLKMCKVFDKIKGIWLGNYENKRGYTLEKILQDVIETEYIFPIIQCDDFGHQGILGTLPIGAKIQLDAKKEEVRIIERIVN